MSRLSFRLPGLPLAVAVGALALAACSDSPISPTRSLASSGASFNVTGTNPLTIASGNATQLCTAQQLNGDYTIPATPYGPFASCGVAVDLTAAINVYNPGWSTPFAGSSWVGFNAKAGPSNEYRANPGRYVYQETFNIPAGVTAPVLDIHIKADNVAAVYLNGKLLGSQTNTDCNPGVLVCNWNGDLHIVDNTAGDFNVGGSNTLTFLVIDLPTGAFELTAPTGGPAPQFGCTTRQPQLTGPLGYTATTVTTKPDHVVAGGGTGVGLTNIGAANQAGCENPTGLDYAGTMSWTVPPPPVCDFITFGRLVLDVGGDKVVISGNAGGNAPDGGILGEIEISIGGVDYHVHTIDTYGLPTNQPLFGDPFARVITGKSGNHTVELRLRDNPNPGQGEPGTQEGDKVWLKIDGVVVVPTQTLDKGNIQLHLNCRGPKD